MARSEILQLAEKIGAPIIKPLLGKAVVPDDSPYTTGGIGLLGTAPSQEALQDCDTLIIAGSSFPYLEFYPKPGQAKGIQIDLMLPGSACGIRSKSAWSDNAGMLLRALLPLIHEKKKRAFLEKTQKDVQQWNALMDERGNRMDSAIEAPGGGASPQSAARVRCDHLL